MSNLYHYCYQCYYYIIMSTILYTVYIVVVNYNVRPHATCFSNCPHLRAIHTHGHSTMPPCMYVYTGRYTQQVGLRRFAYIQSGDFKMKTRKCCQTNNNSNNNNKIIELKESS